jgi:hypothetical protein
MRPGRLLARRLVSQPDLVMVLVLIVLVPTAIIWPIDLEVFAGRVLAWLVVFGAIVQFVYAGRLQGLARITEKAVAASLYLVAGVWSLAHPLAGFSSVSLLLLATFSVSAVINMLTDLTQPGCFWMGCSPSPSPSWSGSDGPPASCGS